MPHRLAALGMPSFGTPVVVRPRLAAQPGVAVSGVSVDNDALLFRAEGAVRAGIWRERLAAGDAELVLPDDDGAYLEPLARAGALVVKRLLPAGAPSYVREIVVVRAGERVALPGQTVGVGGKRAVVVDVPARSIACVDLADLSSRVVARFSAGMDPQLAPLVSVSADGGEALITDALEPRCDARLERLALADGSSTTLFGPMPAPSWIAAAFVPDLSGVVALAQQLGEEPRARVLYLGFDGRGRELFAANVSQPASVPAFIDDNTCVLPLSLAPYAMATYGPTDLCALALDVKKPPVLLTRSGDVKGSARVVEGEVLVEGGDVVVRVQRQR